MLFVYLIIMSIFQTDILQTSNIKPDCPFDIVGTWKSDLTKGSAYFVFRDDGWVNVMGKVDFSVEALPQDFDIIAQLNYSVDDNLHPTRIDFFAKSKSEFFPTGITTFEIVEYRDSQFITLSPNDNSRLKWTRMQARRYFLTFAAQHENIRAGFVTLSVLNGRSIENQSFGFHNNNSPAFGELPEYSLDKFVHDNKRLNILFRIELSESEFNKVNKLIESWNQKITSKSLPYSDPESNAYAFIKIIVDNINLCGSKLKTSASSNDVLEYIATLQKKNATLHITDRRFPKNWKPELR